MEDRLTALEPGPVQGANPRRAERTRGLIEAFRRRSRGGAVPPIDKRPDGDHRARYRTAIVVGDNARRVKSARRTRNGRWHGTGRGWCRRRRVAAARRRRNQYDKGRDEGEEGRDKLTHRPLKVRPFTGNSEFEGVGRGFHSGLLACRSTNSFLGVTWQRGSEESSFFNIVSL